MIESNVTAGQINVAKHLVMTLKPRDDMCDVVYDGRGIIPKCRVNATGHSARGTGLAGQPGADQALPKPFSPSWVSAFIFLKSR
jgi:hypothetical protein